MVRNLPESFVYRRLPDAVISNDERGLVAAIVGGFQDRLEDLRSYSRKLQFFFDPSHLPEPEQNVVLVDLITDQGVAFTRSLDYDDETPAEAGQALTAWAAAELELDVSKVSNVRYGTDLLRRVDVNTLGYLADTIGAVLHQTSISDAEDARRIVQTFFPRLRIKGTALSFEVLGRALGFSDTVFVPLWSRVSARIPDDPGNAINDPDFSPAPEFWPTKTLGPLYDPNVMRDGAFYTWTGTVNQGTAATDFYTLATNGRNPFVNAIVLSVDHGTVTHPTNGTYALSNGGPHAQAYVDAGTSVRFEALAEGESWNGLVISVSGSGTSRLVSITDQLSSIKYRSSYFDLVVVADIDTAADTFGRRSVRPNKDLVTDPELTSDGTALSPYRPWTSGSFSSGSVVSDWLVQTANDAPTVFATRVQSAGTSDELVFGEVLSAAAQVTQAMEEVRPATRFLRRSAAGLMIGDDWPYACYTSTALLATSPTGTITATGSHYATPLPGYYANLLIELPSSQFLAYAENSPTNVNVASYGYASGSLVFTGTYDFSSGTYALSLNAGTVVNASVYAVWVPTDTEVIRAEPSASAKDDGDTACLDRPEDEEGETVDEVVDEYPWLRSVVGGGELVEAAAYFADEGDQVEVDAVTGDTAVLDQDGAPYDGYVRVSAATGHHRLIWAAQSTGSGYLPGSEAVGYRGTFRDLAAYYGTQTDLLNAETDFELQFEPGYSIYLVGLVRGVLVADPVSFNAPAVRDGWQHWFPFNEHAEDALRINEAYGLSTESSGISPEDRTWDDDKGWVLRPDSALLMGCSVYGCADDLTVGFWFKAEAGSTGTTTILELGALSFDFNHASKAITGYARQAAGSSIAVGTVVTSDWNYVALSASAEEAHFVYGTTSLAWTTVIDSFDVGADELVLRGAGSRFSWHDLRIWNQAKTLAQLTQAALYVPVSTMVNYALSRVRSVDKSVYYGFHVLPNGWVEAAQLPPWVRQTQRQAVRRYTSSGSYVGRTAYKEVGLGGGVTAHENYGYTQYPLGYVFPYASDGTVVVTGTTGLLPGNNELWVSTSGASPALQVETNPARDAIWIRGENDFVYEVALSGNPTSTDFVARLVGRGREDSEITINPVYAALLSSGTYNDGTFSGTQPLVGGAPYGPATINGTVVYIGSLSVAEQLTGAEVRLEGSGYRMTVYATGSDLGVVGQSAGAGTTPPVWMYLYARIVEDQSDAWSAWTDNDDTSKFGNSLTPPRAALDANGYLDFENSSQLTPGTYRLYLDTGSLGLTDPDFDGMRVEVSVNNTLVEARLLRGLSGYDIRGWDVLEFYLPSTTTGNWILSVEWLNAYSDPSRGVQRQLVVYAYRLERVAPELFKVDIDPGGGQPTLQNYTVHAGTYTSTVAGGWLRALASAGTFSGQSHESNVVLVETTGTQPLADVLTGCTNDRRQDVIVSSVAGSVVEAEPAAPVFPTFTGLSVVSSGTDPLWLWSSAVNTNPGFTVSAKLPSDCDVRLVVSTEADFSDPVYSAVGHAYESNNRVVKLTVSGLEPWTTYYYAVEINGVLVTGRTGVTRTFGTGARSFKFALGSCANNVRGTAVNTVLWDAVVAKAPDFFLMTGDWHYNNIAVDDVDYFRDALDAIFLSSSEYTFLTTPAANTGSDKQRSLVAGMPVFWIWDDHDYGPNDSDSTSPSRTASRAVYREYCPHFPLQAGGPDAAIYHSFRVGRCVFVVTDNRSERSPKGDPDNASKVVWSEAQKDWFKQQVLAASGDPDVQFIFWVNTFPWIGPASAGSDTWQGYTTARQEIVDWLDANGITRLFILSGDMHAAAIDDGRNAPGGLPVFHAAPLTQTSSNKGGPYLIGPYPAAGIPNTEQFGVVEVLDYGTASQAIFTGYDNAGAVLVSSGTNVTWTMEPSDSPYA